MSKMTKKKLGVCAIIFVVMTIMAGIGGLIMSDLVVFKIMFVCITLPCTVYSALMIFVMPVSEGEIRLDEQRIMVDKNMEDIKDGEIVIFRVFKAKEEGKEDAP